MPTVMIIGASIRLLRSCRPEPTPPQPISHQPRDTINLISTGLSAARSFSASKLVHRGVQMIHPVGAPVWLAPRNWGVRRQRRMNLLSAPVH